MRDQILDAPQTTGESPIYTISRQEATLPSGRAPDNVRTFEGGFALVAVPPEIWESMASISSRAGNMLICYRLICSHSGVFVASDCYDREGLDCL